MDLLQIRDVSKSYVSHHALKNISLTIPKGCIYGLLGPNGAGKTTLIRIVTKIIEADSGQIFFDGKEMTSSTVRRIGYLPEERGLYKRMKVAEQLKYIGQLKGLSKSEATAEIKFWLERLGLMEWHAKPVEDLSKGMAQKVQFIATVLHKPDLIILDEPFSGFDPVNADLIKDEILRLKENGCTVIFSTHRMESVEELCDHIAIIHRSEKVLEGATYQVKENHKTGSYHVKHLSSLHSCDSFEVLHSQSKNGFFESLISNLTARSTNDLLLAIMKQTEVMGFSEKVPSINEIFIQKVNPQ